MKPTWASEYGVSEKEFEKEMADQRKLMEQDADESDDWEFNESELKEFGL